MLDYRREPIEIRADGVGGRLCAAPFTGKLEDHWPTEASYVDRGIYLSCGDSAATGLPDCSIDLVITDPPFFDNVHYSELADFFYAWQQLPASGLGRPKTTRSTEEVQDTNPTNFAAKLRRVLQECARVLKDDGLVVFTYHHSRDEGWRALAEAVLGAGLFVVNSHPVKAEMSVATPKAQAKDPIQLDIVVVCRKSGSADFTAASQQHAMDIARRKIDRLHTAGFRLSRNDQKIVILGQLLTTLESPEHANCFGIAENEFEAIPYVSTRTEPQLQLF